MINQIKRMRGEEGFTLVELLVVMVIIALLAAIAIPAFFGQTDKAKDTNAKEQLRQAYQAAKAFQIDNEGSFDGLTVEDIEEVEPTLDGKITLVPATVAGESFAIQASQGDQTWHLVVSDGVAGTPEKGPAPTSP